MQNNSVGRDAARWQVILDAARDCILKFGYAKCSLEDIAKQAAVSRPLIYRKFKSKEKILVPFWRIFSHSVEPRNTLSQSREAGIPVAPRIQHRFNDDEDADCDRDYHPDFPETLRLSWSSFASAQRNLDFRARLVIPHLVLRVLGSNVPHLQHGPTFRENLLFTHGCGIYLMKTLMDEVSFEE